MKKILINGTALLLMLSGISFAKDVKNDFNISAAKNGMNKEKNNSENQMDFKKLVPKVEKKNKNQENVPINKENNQSKIESFPISYEYSLENYSLYEHDIKAFEKTMKELGVTKEALKFIEKNPFASDRNILVSALRYDYVYNRPDLAENFYQKFNGPKFSFNEKLLLMDFYLRTGRLDEIKSSLTKGSCFSSFKFMHKCFYYIGVVEYIETGNNKNQALMSASQTIKQAKDIVGLTK